MRSQKPWMTKFARENRSRMTLAERVLWHEIKNGKLGVRFRRQDPIGPYIADFSCRTHRLVIEVDGDSHDDPERDRIRDVWFQRHGWTVLRFDNGDVLLEFEATLVTITQTLSAVPLSSPQHSPPFKGDKRVFE